jgi:hypothetical protein
MEVVFLPQYALGLASTSIAAIWRLAELIANFFNIIFACSVALVAARA